MGHPNLVFFLVLPSMQLALLLLFTHAVPLAVVLLTGMLLFSLAGYHLLIGAVITAYAVCARHLPSCKPSIQRHALWEVRLRLDIASLAQPMCSAIRIRPLVSK